jgi:hypothetical protein
VPRGEAVMAGSEEVRVGRDEMASKQERKCPIPSYGRRQEVGACLEPKGRGIDTPGKPRRTTGKT